MVSILPSARTPYDVLGQDVGRALQGVLPQALNQGYQRGMGLSAIDKLQNELQTAQGDLTQILPALARAYTLNPNLERSGLGQFAMQQAKVQNAYGQPQKQGSQPTSQSQTNSLQTQTPPQSQRVPQENIIPQGDFATPSWFNIFTPQDIDTEAKRFAGSVNDVNAYQNRFNQLQSQNAEATAQRQALEQAALDANVDPKDIPRFMVVNQHLDPRNPAQWAQQAKRNFAEVKNNDDILRRTFIPGVGNGLLGQNRQEHLDRLRRPVQENAKRGLEQEDRQYLASHYVTPTEIENLYHPLTPEQEKAIESFPRGLFPASKKETWKSLATAKARQSPFRSYEEVQERDPQALKIQQDQLVDFFSKNIDKNTSLLGLRDKLWSEKDYDWRQIEPAIVQAIQQKGIKLEPFQEREMAHIAQPPLESLPNIFESLDRFMHYLRGSK